MEKQLISFGNYLLKKCKVKGHDLDGDAVFDKEVTDADLCNWRETQKSNDNILPSGFQIGEWVSIDTKGFKIDKAEIIKVHFSQSKVMYDLDVEFNYEINEEEEMAYTRIYNVDSVFLNRYQSKEG